MTILPTAPIVILARPQMGENIGSAARAMMNCGLSDLRLVAPRDGWPNPAALPMAAGGSEIIENARVYDNFVLKWYQSQPFVYTLEPSSIREPNFVDRFLFETQEGFCEHFAYSFVALMRLAGIPARIVGGYMGGELNPINNTITVREMDAHAWTEVWLDELGWMRVDPTGVVAPERIRLGSIDSLRSSASFLSESPLSLLHLNDWQWINTLRWRLDALNYRWQSNIMSYRDKQQSALLKSIIGKITPLRILMLLGATLLLTLVPLMLWFVLRGSALFKTSQQRKLQHIDRRLRHCGVFRLEGETLRQAVKRANAASASDLATLTDAVNAFERTYYAKT